MTAGAQGNKGQYGCAGDQGHLPKQRNQIADGDQESRHQAPEKHGHGLALEELESILYPDPAGCDGKDGRSEEHTSELQSLMRISYAVFCLKKKTQKKHN